MTNNKAFPPIIETISISTQAGKTTEPSGLFLSDQLRQDGRREGREREKKTSRRKRFRVPLFSRRRMSMFQHLASRNDANK